MKFAFYNDSNRTLSIHTATFEHGCIGNHEAIQPQEERTFILPEGTYPWFKLWDNMILVSPRELEEETGE